MKQKSLLALTSLLLFIVLPLTMKAGGESVGTRLTTGRLTSILTGMIGLVGVVDGVRSIRWSGTPKDGRRKAMIALVCGVFCLTLSAIHLLTAKGGFGTGSGKAGAVVGVVLGLAAVISGSFGLKLSKEGRR